MDGLRIVRGEPDDAELAALLVVLARRAPDPGGRHPRSAWSDPEWRSGVRRPRPGAWRRSGLPG
jgi:hypothetical protein